MARWRYWNSAVSPHVPVDLNDVQYQSSADVQAYATAQGHTILGGITGSGSSLVRYEEDPLKRFIDVISDGSLRASARIAAHHVASNKVYLVQETGSAMPAGTPVIMEATAPNAVRAIANPSGHRPILWAAHDIPNSSSGDFVKEGFITGVGDLVAGNTSNTIPHVVPRSAGTTLYWDRTRTKFVTIKAGIWPEVGSIVASRYRLPATTHFASSLSIGNVTISNTDDSNAARNGTVVMPTLASASTRSFSLPNLGGNQPYANVFQVGDQIVFVNPKNSQASFTIQPALGALMQNAAGTQILGYDMNASTTLDQSVIVQRFAGNAWRVVSENADTLHSDLFVDKPMMDEELQRTPSYANYYRGLNFGTASASVVRFQPGGVVSDDGLALIDFTAQQDVTLTTVGIGGRDTSSAISNNTWYYYFAVLNDATGAVGIIASTSRTSPTMPTGYNRKALIGVARCVSVAGVIRSFKAIGRGGVKKYVIEAEVRFASNASVGTSFADVDMTGLVPEMADGYPPVTVTVERGGGQIRLRHADENFDSGQFLSSPRNLVTGLLLSSTGHFSWKGEGSGATNVFGKIQSFWLPLG